MTANYSIKMDRQRTIQKFSFDRIAVDRCVDAHHFVPQKNRVLDYGIPRTIAGPIREVSQTGSFFQSLIANAYRGLSGRASPTRPESDAYCHTAGLGDAPHCFLNLNVGPSGVLRPKSKMD